MASKQALLSFLQKHVFDTILHASAHDYSEADGKKLKEVQDKTRAEVERFRGYADAEELITNYKRDLHSAAAKHVNSELEHLQLPTLPSVKDQFLKEAGE